MVPQTGHYLVQRANGKSLVTQVVDKNKNCSCGGGSDWHCEHIEAVKEYLRDGGEKAPEPKKVTPDETAKKENITVCPTCGEKVEWAGSYAYPLMWRCPKDSSHYWEWYGNNHKVKAFMLGNRPTGIKAIDCMEEGEYTSYLDKVEEFYGYDRAADGAWQGNDAAGQADEAGKAEKPAQEC